MGRSVDENSVIKIVAYECGEFVGPAKEIEKQIKALPSAEPERKKGKWIPMYNGQFTGGAYWFECSDCGRVVPNAMNGGWNFCPGCGADMRGEQDG